MTYVLQVTSTAKRDQRDAVCWYAEHYSKPFAKRWNDGIELAIASLRNNPERCGLVHENERLSMDVRQLVYRTAKRQKHRILFTIDGGTVYVLRIRHSSRFDIEEEELPEKTD
ncbi:MAG: type II toxin-antitoxin system RelE/ParE family toxin [Planctomycetota bacterium]